MTLLDKLYASEFYAPLNVEQRQAADSDQHTIVISAGAGTGKTKTLVARYLRLLLERVQREGEHLPRPFDHLLAITYTNAAAAEMRERIDHALRELGLLSLARQIDGAWISTIHGFCERVIRRHALTVGADPYFSVLDDDRSVLLRRQSFDEALAAYYHRDSARLLHLLSFYSQRQLREACFTIADEAAKIGVNIDDLQPDDFSSDACKKGCPDTAAISSLLDFAGAFQRHYAALKQQRGSCDFHDLLLQCREVLKIGQIAGYYRDQFTEVMLDEAQDANALQLSLLERIASRTFIVGDFKQSIYRFQGADVGVFSGLVERAQDPADETSSAQALMRNYRSRREILDYVNELFATPDLLGELAEELAAGRKSERVSGADAPVRVDGGQDVLEADWIAGEIAALVEAGCYQPSGIVVLVAKRTYGVPIADALKAKGLVARIIGTDDFLSQPHIRAARALLEALRNPSDDAAFLALLLSDLGQVSDQGLYELACAADECCLWEAAGDVALSDMTDAENLRRVCTLLSVAFARLGAAPLSAIIADAFDLDDPATPPQARADLRWLCRLADELQRDGGGLVDLITWLDEKETAKGRIESPVVADDASDVVRIMTIHASKGLQFPVVAVACAQDKSNKKAPSENAFIYRNEIDEPACLGLKHKPPGASDAVCTPTADLAIAKDKTAEEREKVRQLYVACTRAEDVLLLSYQADAKAGVTAKVAHAIETLGTLEKEGEQR